jgi:hypothetical protein
MAVPRRDRVGHCHRRPRFACNRASSVWLEVKAGRLGGRGAVSVSPGAVAQGAVFRAPSGRQALGWCSGAAEGKPWLSRRPTKAA